MRRPGGQLRKEGSGLLPSTCWNELLRGKGDPLSKSGPVLTSNPSHQHPRPSALLPIQTWTPSQRLCGRGDGPSPEISTSQATLRLSGHQYPDLSDTPSLVAAAGPTLDPPLTNEGLLFPISDPVSRKIHTRVFSN